MDNDYIICNDSALCGCRSPSSIPIGRYRSIMWHDLLVAVALLLVIEGVMPFLAPNAMRRMLLEVAGQNNRSLRIAGLLSMIGGVGLLYLIN